VQFAYRSGTPVLKGVSFSLRAGTLTGLVGPNGAGKTTLVQLIRQALKPTGGVIEVAPGGRGARSVAVVEQHLSLFPDLSVAANIFLGRWAGAGLVWMPPAALEREAAAILRKMGVELDTRQPAGALPYPSRQMVEITRAVHEGARLLILDEPTAALDNEARARLLRLLRTLAAQGAAVLLVTHDMDDLRGIADGVISLDEGRAEMVELGAEIPAATRPGVSPSGLPAQLRVSVCLPSGKRMAVEGRDGQTSVWHFENALERSQLLGTVAFPGRPDACRMTVGGRSFSNPSPCQLREEGVRLLLSDKHANGIFPGLNVLQNYLIASGATSLRGWLKGRAGAEQSLPHSGVRFPSLDAPASTLSGGNQQRLLWRALSDSSCQFIFAEEPLWGLDHEARRATLRLMAEINSAGRGVVVLTCFPRAYEGLPVHEPARLDN
jgi:ribose transport system ATP-binding protein